MKLTGRANCWPLRRTGQTGQPSGRDVRSRHARFVVCSEGVQQRSTATGPTLGIRARPAPAA